MSSTWANCGSGGGWRCRWRPGWAACCVPVGIYLAFNAGSTARGWGAAMSTDTAFALGDVRPVGPRLPTAVRAFLLTVAVVDDLSRWS